MKIFIVEYRVKSGPIQAQTVAANHKEEARYNLKRFHPVPSDINVINVKET